MSAFARVSGGTLAAARDARWRAGNRQVAGLCASCCGAIEHERRPVTWRLGRSLPYGEGVTFWALGEIVKAQAGILESDGADQAVRKLRAGRRATRRRPGRDSLARRAAAPLVGAAAEAARRSAGEAFPAWRRLLEALAEPGPLVLVSRISTGPMMRCWTSSTSSSTVSATFHSSSSRPPGRSCSSGAPAGAAANRTPQPSRSRRSRNAPLRSWWRRCSSGRRSTQITTQPLLARIGGNPLYAEQYARALIERGELVDCPRRSTASSRRASTRCRSPRSSSSRTPPSRQCLLGRGARRRSADTTAWSRRRSCAGSIGSSSCSACADSSVAGEVEYAFRHVLLRDVAYGQIPRAVRAEKHRRAAEWIESLGRVCRPRRAARRSLRKRARVRASLWSRRARARPARLRRDARGGERALALSAFASAAAFFTDALALASSG